MSKRKKRKWTQRVPILTRFRLRFKCNMISLKDHIVNVILFKYKSFVRNIFVTDILSFGFIYNQHVSLFSIHVLIVNTVITVFSNVPPLLQFKKNTSIIPNPSPLS